MVIIPVSWSITRKQSYSAKNIKLYDKAAALEYDNLSSTLLEIGPRFDDVVFQRERLQFYTIQSIASESVIACGIVRIFVQKEFR